MPAATADDVHALARAVPHVTVDRPGTPHPVHQVGGKSFVFFRTAHFDGHPSVLLRTARIGGPDRDELAEVGQDAWLAPASKRRADAWLAGAG